MTTGDAVQTTPTAQPSTRALDRGLRLLTCLSENPGGLSAPELAERNDLSRATVYRLLSTLIARDFVTTDPTQRRYWLGPAIERCFFGRESHFTLAALAAPEMERLCNEIGESVGLHIRSGLERIVIRKVEPDHQPLRYVIPVGATRALVTGASGAVLMSEFDDAEIQAALDHEVAAGISTVTPLSMKRIHARIADLRRQGYCEAIAETVEGIASIAVPVHSAEGRVIAALAISGPAQRFDEKDRKRAAELAISRSATITASLRPA
ncbi:MAG: IclR family transcriptional regulator [Nocardioides sp.]